MARRHYENEIDVLARFAYYLENQQNSYKDLEPGEPKRRMPIEKEKELLREKFYKYLEVYGR